jgi:methyl-accepting chemotaxis protein
LRRRFHVSKQSGLFAAVSIEAAWGGVVFDADHVTSLRRDRKMTAESTIRARLAFNQIDEGTSSLLREHKEFIMAELPAVLDRFYDHVSKFPETAAFFRNREHMMSAKQAQLRHWDMITDARFDQGYEASISRIGETHNRIGLDPRWYIGGYNALITGMVEAIAAKLQPPRTPNASVERWLRERGLDRKTALQGALIKAALLDMDLAIAVYLEAGRRERRATLDRLAAEFDKAVAGVVNSVGATARELQAAAEAMTGAARKTADQSTAVAGAAEEASSNVRTVAAAADELSASVREIGRQVASSTDVAGRPSRRRTRPRRRSAISRAPRRRSGRWSRSSATSRGRPTCWRSTPPSKRRAPARPERGLPWSRRR